MTLNNSNTEIIKEYLEPGAIGLIRQTEDGRIMQIGLTERQSNCLQEFLVQISKGSPLCLMGEEHDLVLKSTLKKKNE
jgi:hypothetical protein